MYAKYFKRAIDFCAALALIAVLSPIYILFAILIRIRMGSPVIFTQDRPGLNEKIFRVMKFRSMTDGRDSNGKLLPDTVRLTPLGKFVRKTSIDELPQLFNVLKGDMSFIGPRPLLPRYLPYYTPEERLRHSVRPGITGLAQISGRNNLTWEEKFAFDVAYARAVTFLNDAKIAVKTVRKVFAGSDIVVVSRENFLDVERGGAREKNPQA